MYYVRLGLLIIELRIMQTEFYSKYLRTMPVNQNNVYNTNG